MITSPPAQLDRLIERQRPGHRPTAMAAGCFGGLPWAGLQLRLMTLAFALFLQLRGDASVALMAADFFIVTEGQQHIALWLEALGDQGFHRFEDRHH